MDQVISESLIENQASSALTTEEKVDEDLRSFVWNAPAFQLQKHVATTPNRREYRGQ
jgi:hypothetical protein